MRSTLSQHHLSTQGRDGESLSEIPVTRREGFLAAASIALSSAFVDAAVAPPAALAIYNKDLDKVRVFRHHHSSGCFFFLLFAVSLVAWATTLFLVDSLTTTLSLLE